MSAFSTPAILLRRTDYGDFDIITTFFTLRRGKLSLIAKAAKKSTKRFGGILELFSELEVVGSAGRGRGLPILQEAVLKRPFAAIRSDFMKTTYASYWAELVYNWVEENYQQEPLYHLLIHVLSDLASGRTQAAVLHLLFQVRLLALTGHQPGLRHCNQCRKSLEDMGPQKMTADMQRGGILCADCAPASASRMSLSRGTIKQLLWLESGPFAKAARIKFSPPALKEATAFVEAFVLYHLGRAPRSLKFLRQIRKDS